MYDLTADPHQAANLYKPWRRTAAGRKRLKGLHRDLMRYVRCGMTAELQSNCVRLPVRHSTATPLPPASASRPDIGSQPSVLSVPSSSLGPTPPNDVPGTLAVFAPLRLPIGGYLALCASQEAVATRTSPRSSVGESSSRCWHGGPSADHTPRATCRHAVVRQISAGPVLSLAPNPHPPLSRPASSHQRCLRTPRHLRGDAGLRPGAAISGWESVLRRAAVL